MAVTAKNLGAAQQGRRPLNGVVFPKGNGGGNHVISTFAGHHRGSRRRQRSPIYGASDWSLTLVVVVCIYGTQCMVGLLADTPASICLRARLQDRTTICMACSAFFVISRMCRSVVSISLRGAALVSSFARSCTAANMARIL